jgi:hypothetical protein
MACNEARTLGITQLEVAVMNPPVKLLQDIRASALIDARIIELRLAYFTEKAETTGIKTNLRSLARMFHDYADTLDESIHKEA